MNLQTNRKDEHVRLASEQYQANKPNDFDSVHFVHQSLPSVDVTDVSLTTSFSGWNQPLPLYINGMTGGSQATKKINHDLAIVARETGLLMASGSVSAALKDPTTLDSFTVIRQENPNGIVLANLGPDHSLEHAKRAVDLLQADGLQIHLNAPQELVMPEGDRSFRNWIPNIEKIVNQVGVPVIIKEVGFGMSRETIQQLIEIGVATIDVSGRGGTNFIQIENERRMNKDYHFLTKWGQSTAISLLEANEFLAQVTILASGGLQNSLHFAKALALGATSCGLSGQFLHLIQSVGVDGTIQQIQQWQEELTTILTLLGCRSIADLQKTPLVFNEPLTGWCHARNIETKKWANRTLD